MLEMEKMQTMLFSGFKQWEREKSAEGRAKGRVEGKAEGKAEALLSLLSGRFGQVPPSTRQRILRARLRTLERWFDRAIVAPNLRSVFNPRR